MTAPDELVALVTKVTTTARDFTPRRSVELGVLHGLCLDAARKHEPHLVEFVASVPGLIAISGILSQLPHIIASNDPDGAMWSFVRLPEG